MKEEDSIYPEGISRQQEMKGGAEEVSIEAVLGLLFVVIVILLICFAIARYLTPNTITIVLK